VAFYWWPALIDPGGAARGAAARLDLPVPAPSHDRRARNARASLQRGETSWKVQKSPPPKPFSTTADSAPRSGSRPDDWRSRHRVPVAAYLDEETMLLSATTRASTA
jgi:hypothetical protein